MRKFIFAALPLLFVGPAAAQPIDPLDRIIDQGTNHSQVMQTAEYLADHIGGRLTNSPAMRQAEAWTQAQLR